MPGMPPPAADERQTLIEFLRFNQDAFFSVAYGLTDEQARSAPSVSSLSIGGLIKHAANVQKGWVDRASAAPDMPPRDERPMEEIMAEYADQYVMREDETLAELLTELAKQNAETLRVFAEADLDTPVPVPQRRAVVSAGHRQLVGALGGYASHRGAGTPRRARRHHSRNHRRRNDVRADGRPTRDGRRPTGITPWRQRQDAAN